MHYFLGDVPVLRIISASVCDSGQKGILLWLMVCLLKVVGCLPLPVETWQCLPRTRLIWAYVERLSSALEPYLLKSLPTEPQSDPPLSLAAPYITALSPTALCAHTKIFLRPGIIFHSPQDWDRRDNSTPPKDIWLGHSSTSLNMINLFL